jgi:hypothetical protein
MRLVRYFAGASLALSVGCTCRAVGVPAVVVTVVDRKNVPVRDASVTYLVDDGPVESADCVPPPPESRATCDRWHAGMGRAGTIAVTAKSADRTRSASQTVEVEMDGCHPEQKSITVQLR